MKYKCTKLGVGVLLVTSGCAFVTGVEGQNSMSYAISQDCPLRFGEFPQTISSPNLGNVVLTAKELRSVQILSPQSEGLSVLRVEAKGPEAIYGSYMVRGRLETTQLILSIGMKELDWSTASETPGDTISTVRPGFLRVEMRYISPSTARRPFTRVCVAISPAFELTEAFQLMRAE